jgi:hypothetical protein
MSGIGKWGGRLTAVLLILFWGAFFVEHMSEWVWVQQGMHFLTYISLINLVPVAFFTVHWLARKS